jgi:small multidrug resistance pump
MIKVPLNIAYATWSGIGLLLSTVVAVILYKEAINISTIVGLTLIIVGVVILNLYSTK